MFIIASGPAPVRVTSRMDTMELLSFAGGPFLIVLRESLEAGLIIAIVFGYLSKIGRGDLNRYLYAGGSLAILFSLFLGMVIFLVLGSLSGVQEQLFEGTAAIIATLVLTYMIFWMGRNSRGIRMEIEGKIETSISTGYLTGIALIAFVAVFREGVETVLFLSTAMSIDILATVIGAAFGTATTLALMFLMVKGIYRLNLAKFFSYTSLLLVIFAAGLSGFGVHELLEAGEEFGLSMGFLGENAFDLNPVDATHPLHERGAVGSVMRALIGYDGNPEWLRVIIYLGYWAVVGSYLMITYLPKNPISRILVRNASSGTHLPVHK